MKPPLFAFDLDGTVTTREILPLLARELSIEQTMEELTRQTIAGEIPFETSFRHRVRLLQELPLQRAREVVEAVPLNEHIAAFIRYHKEHCVVLTGNLDCWVEPLLLHLGCRWQSSQAISVDGKMEVTSILDKGRAAKSLRCGRFLVAIGESLNDVPMFQEADLGIAFAGVHEPAEALKSVAQRRADTGESLCSILERICAGSGVGFVRKKAARSIPAALQNSA